MKKSLLAFGASAAVIAPIATAVSCSWGYEGRYDTENDGELSILYAFSKNKQQDKALQAIRDIWNSDTTHNKLVLNRVEGGYKTIGPQLAQSFEAGDTKKIPNMIIDYPDTLGVLSKYEMTIPLTKHGDSTKWFDQAFLEINNQIGGIKKDSGTYALPIAKSIDMATYNTPVFKRIWMVAKKHGIADGDLPTSWKNTSDSEASRIKEELWVEAKPNSVSRLATKFKFVDIKNNSEKMLDFVSMVRPLFKENKETYILGIDSATNFVYQAVYQAAQANYKDFIFSKGDNGYIDYNWGKGEAKKVFERVYKKLRKAIQAKAIYLNVGGEYSSGLETQHKIGVAYGSTAGYKHNYLGASTPMYNKKMFTSYTDKLNDDGTYSNYKHEMQPTVITTTALKNFWANHKDRTHMFLTSSSVVGVNPNDMIKATDGDHPKYIVKMTGFSKADATLQKEEMEIMETPTKFNGTSAKAALVQGPSLMGVHANGKEDEDVIAFSKWFMEANLTIITTQKSGEHDTYKVGNVKIKNAGSAKIMKPYEIFSAMSGYIVPTISALNKKEINGNPAQKLTFEVLKSISADKDYHSFDNPVDDTTGIFRKRLETALGTDYTAAKADAHVMTSEELYETMNW